MQVPSALAHRVTDRAPESACSRRSGVGERLQVRAHTVEDEGAAVPGEGQIGRRIPCELVAFGGHHLEAMVGAFPAEVHRRTGRGGGEGLGENDDGQHGTSAAPTPGAHRRLRVFVGPATVTGRP